VHVFSFLFLIIVSGLVAITFIIIIIIIIIIAYNLMGAWGGVVVKALLY